MRKAGYVGFVVLLVLLPLIHSLAQTEVKKVAKETLKAWLGQPDLVIIDLRIPMDWIASDKKIKGAVYRDPIKVAGWGKHLPKDKKIVLYCA